MLGRKKQKRRKRTIWKIGMRKSYGRLCYQNTEIQRQRPIRCASTLLRPLKTESMAGFGRAQMEEISACISISCLPGMLLTHLFIHSPADGICRISNVTGLQIYIED